MKELRDLIDTNCPMIYAGNWRSEHKKGWRWVDNIENDDENAKSIIVDYQTAHGVMNVAIGHTFSDRVQRPDPTAGQFGLYVRDVEDLVHEIQKGLDDPAAIERWLNGDENGT